jgi:hypothetical protein
LPGYLPLLAALPALLHARLPWHRAWVIAALALAMLGQIGGLTYLGLAASDRGANVLAGMKAFPARFVGWRESGEMARELLAKQPRVFVADNFMLAAEIDFQLNGAVPVYALDNPLNVKHGRAPQLAIWQRDEIALRRLHGLAPMLLAVDEKALRVHERADWLRTLCGRMVQPTPLSRLDLFDGRRRIAFYAGIVPSALPLAATSNDTCVIWRNAAGAEDQD